MDMQNASKRSELFNTTKIYLATPWFNKEQKNRVEEVSKLLSNNPTVGVIHFPFDYQYKNANIDNKDGIFGSLEWQVATYQNDLSAMGTADCGVFLYDLDNVDDGTAFEVGYMRSMGKPAIIVTFSHNKNVKVNLMIARGATAFIDGDKNLNDLVNYNFNHFPSNPVCTHEVF